jgi:hypothetical protein
MIHKISDENVFIFFFGRRCHSEAAFSAWFDGFINFDLRVSGCPYVTAKIRRFKFEIKLDWFDNTVVTELCALEYQR